jgi:hypothetical protein
MPRWASTFVLLVGMVAWLAIVSVSLWIKKIPDAWIIGFPAALWLALTGESRITRRRANQDEPAAEVATTDREGDTE